MSGKTIAFVGSGLGLVVALVGGFALLQDDTGRPKPTPGAPPTNQANNVPKPNVPSLQSPQNAPAPPPPPKTPRIAGNGPGPTAPKTNPPSAPPAPPMINTAPTKVVNRVVPGPGGGPVIVVRGADNQPVVGAVVEASTRRGSLTARPTNKSGEAALDPIAADAGKVSGTVRHPKYPQAASFSCEPKATRVEVRFAAAATGSLVGIIHDARGQAPLTADLIVKDPNGGETVLPSSGFVSYDASGRFKVDLAPGKYSVMAQAPGYCASELAYPTVVENQESGNVDLLLEAAAAIIGKVTLPPELQVQRDPIVLTFDIEWVRGDMQNPTTTIDHRSITLGSDGAFVIEDLQSGMYRIRAGDGKRLTNWAAAKLDEGSRVNTTPLHFDAGPSIPPVRGLVRDSAGGVVAGAIVRTRVAQAQTDAGGAFELRGLDGGQKHDLTIEKPGYVTLTGFVEVPLAGQPAGPDLVYTLDRKSSASGKVTRKGQPAAGVRVVIVQKIDTGPGSAPMFMPSPVVTTDGAGRWQVNDLETGNYFLKAGKGADSPFDESGGTPFVVRSGQVAEVGAVEVP